MMYCMQRLESSILFFAVLSSLIQPVVSDRLFDHFSGKPILIIFFGVAAINFLMVGLPHVVRYCIRRHADRRRRAVAPRLVETFQQQRYTASGERNAECHICLTDFEENEHVRVLPCDHIYHHNCILEWMGRNTTCPDCRRCALV